MPKGVYIRTKEHNQHLSEANLGKKIPTKTKEKISRTLKKLFREGKLQPPDNYGKKHTEERKKKIGMALKGRPSWNKGLKGWTNSGSFKKGVSPWNKGKMMPASVGQAMRKYQKKLWSNPQFKEKKMKEMFEIWKKKPNKAETALNNILQENFPNQFQYTGDGKVVIEGFNPDFVCNPSKRIIELFGEYHHNLPKVVERDKRRLEVYKKYGFSTLIVWSDELKKPHQVVNKIKDWSRIG
jgi:very-short-patch-repair endonuclease